MEEVQLFGQFAGQERSLRAISDPEVAAAAVSTCSSLLNVSPRDPAQRDSQTGRHHRGRSGHIPYLRSDPEQPEQSPSTS